MARVFLANQRAELKEMQFTFDTQSKTTLVVMVRVMVVKKRELTSVNLLKMIVENDVTLGVY